MTTARSTLWLALAIGVLMLYPYPVSMLVAGGGTSSAHAIAGHLCILQADLMLLLAGFVMALGSRMLGDLALGDPLVDRVAAVAVLLAVQDLPLTALAIVVPEHEGYAYRLTITHLLTVVVVLVMTVRMRRAPRPYRSPLLVGLLLGLVTLAPQLLLVAVGGPTFLDVRMPADLVVLFVSTALVLGLAVQLISSDLPLWAAWRLSGAVLALYAGRVWATVTEASQPPPVTVVAIVFFSALLATTVIGLLRRALAEVDGRLAVLVHRTADAEATVQHDREVAHEVRAAVAGVVAGAQLLANDQVSPGPRKTALLRMIETEAARLNRSLSAESPGTPSEVDVDAVIEPLVVAHEARGHVVCWNRTGHRTIGHPDAVAEVLSILLSNADRHARGAGTTIVVTRRDGMVEIRVADQGPGLDPVARAHLFEWGARGSTSQGEGIGLQRAHRVMLEEGGTLTLASSDELSGTTFVLRLPCAAVRTERPLRDEGQPPEPHVQAPASVRPDLSRAAAARGVAS
ncbi:sensor histidine kinase [Nocardioides sp. zg-ZUI104]|uniref:sensor histidine kinase n=1 Tax=Nocardioides faecalis TaxID=2803858 RepID=UPI001BD16AEA|nr:sensor histidine kinase [Nocardioides faecalis]MBS4752896.1 sensor histidine kinase [Nocardioides faecalis]